MPELLQHRDQSERALRMDDYGFRSPDDAPDLLRAGRQFSVLKGGIGKCFIEASDFDQGVAAVGAVASQIDAARPVGRPFAERIEFSLVGRVNLPFNRNRLGIVHQRLVYFFQPRPVRQRIAVGHRYDASLGVANSEISRRGRAFRLLPEIANIEAALSKFINYSSYLFLRPVVADDRFVLLAREILRGQRPQTGSQITATVAGRDDDRDFDIVHFTDAKRARSRRHLPAMATEISNRSS